MLVSAWLGQQAALGQICPLVCAAATSRVALEFQNGRSCSAIFPLPVRPAHHRLLAITVPCLVSLLFRAPSPLAAAAGSMLAEGLSSPAAHHWKHHLPDLPTLLARWGRGPCRCLLRANAAWKWRVSVLPVLAASPFALMLLDFALPQSAAGCTSWRTVWPPCQQSWRRRPHFRPLRPARAPHTTTRLGTGSPSLAPTACRQALHLLSPASGPTPRRLWRALGAGLRGRRGRRVGATRGRGA